MSPRRLIPEGNEEKAIIGIMLMCLILLVVLVGVLIRIPHVSSAELKLPKIITRDFGRPSNTVDAINDGRWSEMCKGAARYEAMREAYELRKPDPCNGAKTWVR